MRPRSAPAIRAEDILMGRSQINQSKDKLRDMNLLRPYKFMGKYDHVESRLLHPTSSYLKMKGANQAAVLKRSADKERTTSKDLGGGYGFRTGLHKFAVMSPVKKSNKPGKVASAMQTALAISGGHVNNTSSSDNHSGPTVPTSTVNSKYMKNLNRAKSAVELGNRNTVGPSLHKSLGPGQCQIQDASAFLARGGPKKSAKLDRGKSFVTFRSLHTSDALTDSCAEKEDIRNSLSNFLVSTELAHAAREGKMIPMELQYAAAQQHMKNPASLQDQWGDSNTVSNNALNRKTGPGPVNGIVDPDYDDDFETEDNQKPGSDNDIDMSAPWAPRIRRFRC